VTNVAVHQGTPIGESKGVLAVFVFCHVSYRATCNAVSTCSLAVVDAAADLCVRQCDKL
jgi:hypothetical protein